MHAGPSDISAWLEAAGERSRRSRRRRQRRPRVPRPGVGWRVGRRGPADGPTRIHRPGACGVARLSRDRGVHSMRWNILSNGVGGGGASQTPSSSSTSRPASSSTRTSPVAASGVRSPAVACTQVVAAAAFTIRRRRIASGRHSPARSGSPANAAASTRKRSIQRGRMEGARLAARARPRGGPHPHPGRARGG